MIGGHIHVLGDLSSSSIMAWGQVGLSGVGGLASAVSGHAVVI